MSAFTVIRNAILMDYPIVESIKSLLPLVDEFVVGVGQSDDNTMQLIENIDDSKIRIFRTHWDTGKAKGGLVLSEKTNEALALCRNDWCFYLQADEVVHETDFSKIEESLSKYENNPLVQGLLFKYTHFYGSYDVIATARNWYRNEIRIIRKSTGIQSHGDAQGFRVHGRKPVVGQSGASIYHYGWVKAPQKMGEKSKLLSRWWHGSEKDRDFDDFGFTGNSYGLRPFVGDHPKVMEARLETQDWTFQPKKTLRDWSLRELNYLASDVFETLFGLRIGEYKGYKLIKG